MRRSGAESEINITGRRPVMWVVIWLLRTVVTFSLAMMFSANHIPPRRLAPMARIFNPPDTAVIRTAAPITEDHGSRPRNPRSGIPPSDVPFELYATIGASCHADYPHGIANQRLEQFLCCTMQLLDSPQHKTPDNKAMHRSTLAFWFFKVVRLVFPSLLLWAACPVILVVLKISAPWCDVTFVPIPIDWAVVSATTIATIPTAAAPASTRAVLQIFRTSG